MSCIPNVSLDATQDNLFLSTKLQGDFLAVRKHTRYELKGRVERIFFFASFKLPLFNEYEMVFIIA